MYMYMYMFMHIYQANAIQTRFQNKAVPVDDTVYSFMVTVRRGMGPGNESRGQSSGPAAPGARRGQ